MTEHSDRRAVLITCLSCMLHQRVPFNECTQTAETGLDVKEVASNVSRYLLINGWIFAVPAVEVSAWD